ncbi:hypothetical protein FRC00_012979, partial [Tulasnella sp. 408]
MRRPKNKYGGTDGLKMAQHRTETTAATKSNTKPNPRSEPSAIAVKKRKQSLEKITTQESDLRVPPAKKLKADSSSELENNNHIKRLTNKTSLSSSLRATSASTEILSKNIGPIQSDSVSLDIDHGYFQSMADGSKIIRLKMDADGFERQFQVVGQDGRKRWV